ncbi:MAG TPA: hypothetical protein DD706_16520 [Nitrospiraceae bacterium]|nr:hypothetical protein [Nitrospiraceae bacterium]
MNCDLFGEKISRSSRWYTKPIAPVHLPPVMSFGGRLILALYRPLDNEADPKVYLLKVARARKEGEPAREFLLFSHGCK